jgi:hypothetical protein
MPKMISILAFKFQLYCVWILSGLVLRSRPRQLNCMLDEWAWSWPLHKISLSARQADQALTIYLSEQGLLVLTKSHSTWWVRPTYQEAPLVSKAFLSRGSLCEQGLLNKSQGSWSADVSFQAYVRMQPGWVRVKKHFLNPTRHTTWVSLSWVSGPISSHLMIPLFLCPAGPPKEGLTPHLPQPALLQNTLRMLFNLRAVHSWVSVSQKYARWTNCACNSQLHCSNLLIYLNDSQTWFIMILVLYNCFHASLYSMLCKCGNEQYMRYSDKCQNTAVHQEKY